jgi:copper chaperone CopZ
MLSSPMDDNNTGIKCFQGYTKTYKQKIYMKIYVKNMACESCVLFVKETLEELGIPAVKVELGEIETIQDVSDVEKKQLDNKIRKVGLELLEKKQGVLIEKIRKIMVDYVYKSDEKPNIKFSALLSKELNHSWQISFQKLKPQPLSNLLSL